MSIDIQTVNDSLLRNLQKIDDALVEFSKVKTLFSGAVPPENPQTGQIWFDENTGILKRYDGTNWVDVVAIPDLTNVDDLTILNKLKNVDGAGSGLDADLFQGQPKSDFLLRAPDFDSGWFIPSRAISNVITLTHNFGVEPRLILLIKKNLDNSLIQYKLQTDSRAGSSDVEYEQPLTIHTDTINIYLHIYNNHYLFYWWDASTSIWRGTDNTQWRLYAWK